MNTTPIEKCSIGTDAEYTVKIATERGWSDFSIYPNGNLEGKAPNGETDFVPNYARMAKDAAFDLLAALESLGVKPEGYCWCSTQEQVANGHTGECNEALLAVTKARGEVK